MNIQECVGDCSQPTMRLLAAPSAGAILMESCEGRPLYATGHSGAQRSALRLASFLTIPRGCKRGGGALWLEPCVLAPRAPQQGQGHIGLGLGKMGKDTH